MIPDSKGAWEFDKSKTVLGELQLENKGFFPRTVDEKDTSEFVFNIFRTFESFDVISDRLSYFVEITPIVTESFTFLVESNLKKKLFDMQLMLQFYKYMFSFNRQKNRRAEGNKYYYNKIRKDLFHARVCVLAQ